MRLSIAAIVAALLWQPPVAPLRPVFVDGLAQPVFPMQGVVRHNVWVDVPGLDSDRDGATDRIRLQIHRPGATEQGTRLPVVLIASPYAGGTLPYPRHDVEVELFVPGRPVRAARMLPPEGPANGPGRDAQTAASREIRASGYESYFLPRGFVFVYANSLGTGASTGCPTIGGREESLAVKAAIDWLNGAGRGHDGDGRVVQPYWTTGATAMIGTSYDGTLPLGAATLGVEGLKAIVPIAAVSSYYEHRRSYGTVINSNPVIGTDADTLFDNVLSRGNPEACTFMRARIVQGMDRATGDYNAFWEERDYTAAVSRRFRAAVLMQHGLNDFNTKPRHAARLWQALETHRVPAQIWWHQGGHGDRANQARQSEWRETVNRFWTQYLFGVDSGEMRGPRVTIEREDNTWVTADNWPHPDAAAVTLSLTGAADGPGALGLSPAVDRGPREQSFTDNAAIDATVLASAPESPHRLLYLTAPLARSTHMSGTPRASLRLSFSAPAAIVSAMLVDYRPTGSPVIVTRGWADPQNRESLERTSPIEPGRSYTIGFELQPHDYMFAAGSRIGLIVLSSDRLFTLRPPPGTRLTLRPGESRVVLPLVGGRRAVASRD